MNSALLSPRHLARVTSGLSAALVLVLGACAEPSSGADAGGATLPGDAASSPSDASVADATPHDAGARGTQDAAQDAGSEPDGAGLPTCPDGDSPAITAARGDRDHGASLRILGCRFGAKEQPGPRLYDTVDNQPAYDALSTGDRIPTEGDAPWTRNIDKWRSYVRFATDDPRGLRTAFYRVGGGDDTGDGHLGWPRALGGTSPPADQRMLYVSWWYRPSIGPGSQGGSNKFVRIWDHESGDGTRVSWTHKHITYEGMPYAGWTSWEGDGRVGEWNRMEIDVDTGRGTIRAYVNGIYQRPSNSSHPGDFDIDDLAKDSTYDDVGLNVAVLGFDHGGSSYGEMVTDFGEIYVDTTRARVEVGDAPTWEATRHREIQAPTAWSGGAIEVELNRGSFDSLGGRYLYVVDAEGRVNADGFAL